jgi:NAD(P)-dependent dehydrogenase (short-subunit alcohol dehydrogenase family)
MMQPQPLEQDFAGRVAVVTGGASGQGRAIALALSARGASVAIGSDLGTGRQRVPGTDTHMSSAAELSETQRANEAFGVQAHAQDLDVRWSESTAAFMPSAADRLGPVDILACAAGTIAEVAPQTDELWHEVL